MALHGGTLAVETKTVEVIDDLPDLHQVACVVRSPVTIDRVTSEPGGTSLPFLREGNAYHVMVPKFACHQMVVFHHRLAPKSSGISSLTVVR